jgi:hypothetical protein
VVNASFHDPGKSRLTFSAKDILPWSLISRLISNCKCGIAAPYDLLCEYVPMQQFVVSIPDSSNAWGKFFEAAY